MKIDTIAKQLFPHSLVLGLADYWEEVVDYAELNTPETLAMFLAQTGVESRYYQTFEENLSYSVTNILSVFPRLFRLPSEGEKHLQYFTDGKANALFYDRNPRALANFAYAGKMGNGPESSGAGWRFHGRGAIQLTLHDNYYNANRDLFPLLGRDIYNHPNAVAEPRIGLLVAGWYWKKNNLNETARLGHVKLTTRRINRACLHLLERNNLYNKALKLL